MSNKALIEAALFVSGRDISTTELSKISGIDGKEILRILAELQGDYSKRDSGLEITRNGNSFSMGIRREFEDRVMHLTPHVEIPSAMLKTLAIIAYEQPIMQSRLVSLRGTRVYYYIKKLLEMELISAKRKGRSKELTTTPKFKEYFQIEDLRGKVTPPEQEELPEEEPEKIEEHEVIQLK